MLDRRSKPPSVNRQGHIRGRRLNDDVILRRCLLFIILHHRRCFSDGRTVKWYFGNISQKQIKLIALSLFTRRRRVARSANYPRHGPGARSLQWNAIRSAAGQSSVHRVLFILQIALCLRLYSQIASCTWRRRDAEVRKTFVFFCK